MANPISPKPIEDALNARIAELEAENSRLATLLHDVLSQLLDVLEGGGE